MPKSVARRNEQDVSPVSGWSTTKDILADVHHSLSQFRSGRMDCETARVHVSHFKVAAAIMATELEHARLTKRLVESSPNLPGVRIAASIE